MLLSNDFTTPFEGEGDLREFSVTHYESTFKDSRVNIVYFI